MEEWNMEKIAFKINGNLVTAPVDMVRDNNKCILHGIAE